MRLVLAALLGAQLLVPLGASSATLSASGQSLPTLTSDVTLTAPKTGYLRVRLTRTLDLRRFNIYSSPPTFSGPGAVGMALLPDKVGSLARNVIIVRTQTDRGIELVEGQAQGYDPATGEEGTPRLLPGTYRLFFLTRGGGSVRLRLPGLPSGTQRLTARSAVPWALGNYAAPVDAQGTAPASWEATLDYDGRQPGHVFAALWLHSAATAYMRGGACYFTSTTPAAERNQPLCMGGGNGGGIERIGPALDRTDRLWHGSIYNRPPGKQSLRLFYVSGGKVTRAGAVMFFLPAQ